MAVDNPDPVPQAVNRSRSSEVSAIRFGKNTTLSDHCRTSDA